MSCLVDEVKIRLMRNVSLYLTERTTKLTWLNVAHNRLTTLEGVEEMQRLVCLNAGHNGLKDAGSVAQLTCASAAIPDLVIYVS